jgi:hypothetical protein
MRRDPFACTVLRLPVPGDLTASAGDSTMDDADANTSPGPNDTLRRSRPSSGRRAAVLPPSPMNDMDWTSACRAAGERFDGDAEAADVTDPAGDSATPRDRSEPESSGAEP